MTEEAKQVYTETYNKLKEEGRGPAYCYLMAWRAAQKIERDHEEEG